MNIEIEFTRGEAMQPRLKLTTDNMEQDLIEMLGDVGAVLIVEVDGIEEG